MAYEYTPDAPRSEEYPVQEELADMLVDLPTDVSIDNIKYFDPLEQNLIILAVRELADVIESSHGSHSSTYYRCVILSELFGFEDMDEQAQEAACRIALGLYRKAHPENDPKRGNGNMGKQSNAGALGDMTNQITRGSMMGNMDDASMHPDEDCEGEHSSIQSELKITATDANETTFSAVFSRSHDGWEVEMYDDTNGEWIASDGDYGREIEGYDFDCAYESLSESSYEGYESNLDMDDVQDVITALGAALEDYQNDIDKGSSFDFQMRDFDSATLEYTSEHGVSISLAWDGGEPVHFAGCDPRPTGSENGNEENSVDADDCGDIKRPDANIETLMRWAKQALSESDYNALQQLPYIELSKIVDKWNDENIADEELTSDNALLAPVIEYSVNGVDSVDAAVDALNTAKTEESETSTTASTASVDAPAQRKLTVVGCENRGICFTAIENDGKLTFTAQTFGIGEEVELFSTAVDDLEDNGMMEIPFSEASFEWENIPNMASAFPSWEEDENGFYNEAENAYCHALVKMFGFENIMSCDVNKVVGYENMESIQKDEEYESIFAMLRGMWGIALDEEQKEKFKNGETFEARTPFGDVEVDSKKLMEEIGKNKEANENGDTVPQREHNEPNFDNEAGWDGEPIEAYAKVEWNDDEFGISSYCLAVTEKSYFDQEQVLDDGQTDEYFGIQNMLPSYVGEMTESIYEVDPSVCPESMSIEDVQAKISADCNPNLTLIWNDLAFDAL